MSDLPASAFEVECDTCHQDPYRRCEDENGNRLRGFHAARVELYRARRSLFDVSPLDALSSTPSVRVLLDGQDVTEQRP